MQGFGGKGVKSFLGFFTQPEIDHTTSHKCVCLLHAIVKVHTVYTTLKGVAKLT